MRALSVTLVLLLLCTSIAPSSVGSPSTNPATRVGETSSGAIAAGVQSSPPSDVVPPPPGLATEDFLNLDLVLWAFPTNGSLLVQSNITLAVTGADIGRIDIAFEYVDSNFTINNILDDSGPVSAYWDNTTNPPELQINLTTNHTAGEVVHLYLNYNVTVDRTSYVRPNGLFLDGRDRWGTFPDNPQGRYPDRYLGNVSVRVPTITGWDAWAAGEFVQATSDGTWESFDFILDGKVPYLGVAAGTWVEDQQTTAGVSLQSKVGPEAAANSTRLLDEASNITAFLDGFLGSFDRANLTIVEVPTLPFDGIIAFRNLIVLPHAVAIDDPQSVDFVSAFTIQFFYFGIAPAGAGGSSVVNWGLDAYVVARYFEAVKDDSSRISLAQLSLQGGASPTSLINITDNAYDDNDNARVVAYLHMLRYLVGNTSISAGITQYVQGALGDQGTIADLENALKANAGKDIDLFWSTFFTTSRVLDFSITGATAYRDSTGAEFVHVSVHRTGLASMPVDILVLPQGLLLPMAWNGSADAELDFPTVGLSSQVQLDPDRWLAQAVQGARGDDTASAITNDLEVVSLAVTPTSGLVDGDSLDVSMVVKSTGFVTLPSVEARIEADNGSVLVSFLPQDLQAQKSATYVGSMTVHTGNQTLLGVVDPANLVLESNESNNNGSKEIAVSPPAPIPDLTFLGPLTVSPAVITQGDSEVFVTGTIVNLGDSALSGIQVASALDTTHLSTVSLALSAGNSAAVSFEWADVVSGTHTWELTIDPADLVDESNESNNIISGEFRVNRKPVALLTATANEVEVLEAVVLSGNASRDDDVDGQVAQYLFDFGDGTDSGWVNTSFVIHRYAIPDLGGFAATLKVRDEHGAESALSSSQDIVVRPRVPAVALAVSPASGNITTLFQFTPTVESPDVQVTNYHWSFGDTAESSQVAPGHKFPNDQEYEVTVQVWYFLASQRFESEPASLIVRVNNLPPIADFIQKDNQGNSKTSYPQGTLVTFDAVPTSDPDDKVKDLTFEWRFRGTKEVVQVGAKISHVFDEVGPVVVLLTVSDDDRQSSTKELALNITKKTTTVPHETPAPRGLGLGVIAAIAAGALIAVFAIAFLVLRRRSKSTPLGGAKGPGSEQKGTDDQPDEAEEAAVVEEE